jgi:hypothetical protein
MQIRLMAQTLFQLILMHVAYGTVDCIEVEANQAYGTNTVPTVPNVAYGTHPPQVHDYDYIDLP